ncbi:hypothetical protein OAH87_05280, partial [Marinomonas sp.]
RFTKSMLLAQGGFSAFLNATANDRAELLEELTGTEIYGQVSQWVFEKHKDERQKITQLETLNEQRRLMPDEDFQQLSEQESGYVAEDIKLAHRLKQHQSHLDWLRTKENLSNQLAIQQQKKDQSTTALEDFRPQERKLTRASVANALTPQYDIFQDKRQRLSELKKEHSTVAAQRLEQSQKALVLKSQYDVVKQKFEAQTLAWKQVNEMVSNTASPLLAKQNNLEERVVEFTNRHMDLQRKHDDSLQAIQQLTTQEGSITLACQNSESCLAEWHSPEKVESQIDSWIFQENVLSQHHQKQLELASEINDGQAKLDLALNHHAQNKTVFKEKEAQVNQSELRLKDLSMAYFSLSDDRELSDWKAYFYELDGKHKQANELQLNYQSYQTKLNQCLAGETLLGEVTTKVKQKNDELIAQRAVYKIKKTHRDDLSRLVEAERHILILSELRTKLSEHEHCPLCGSHEHDFPHALQQGADESNLARLEQFNIELDLLVQSGMDLKAGLQVIEHKFESQKNSTLSLREELTELNGALLQQRNLLSDSPVDTLNEQDVFACIEGVFLQWKVASEKDALLTIKHEERLSLELECKQASEQLQQMQFQRQQLETEGKLLRQALKTKQREYEQVVIDSNGLRESLFSALEKAKVPDEYLAEPLNASLVALKSSLEQWRDAKDSHTLQGQNLEKIRIEIQASQSRLVEMTSEKGKSSTQLDLVTKELAQIQNELKEVLGARSVVQILEDAQNKLDDCGKAFERVQQEREGVSSQLTSLKATLESLDKSLTLLSKETVSSQLAWKNVLNDSDFGGEDAWRAACLPLDIVNSLTQTLIDLKEGHARCITLLKQSQDAFDSHVKEKPTNLERDMTVETLLQSVGNIESQRQQLNRSLGEVVQKHKEEVSRREQAKNALEELVLLRGQLVHLERLNHIIGSADGAKFRRFAQSLTLDHLVYLANQHLRVLHGRYQLARQEDALSLAVVDTWQANVSRDTKTLSGGESFLVSLALALALSDLVSHKTSIDSLFLDEGFGTLDSETLESALDALDNLHSSGKTIGIISHINALKERIPVQIKLSKQSGLGVSRLSPEFFVCESE